MYQGRSQSSLLLLKWQTFYLAIKEKSKMRMRGKGAVCGRGPVWRVLKQGGTVTETTLLLAHAGLACVQGSPGSPG